MTYPEGRNYRDMSHEQLEECARELCLPVPAAMSKKELVQSLEKWVDRRAEGEHSGLHSENMSELRQIAKDQRIPEAWELNKEQLVAEIRRTGYTRAY